MEDDASSQSYIWIFEIILNRARLPAFQIVPVRQKNKNLTRREVPAQAEECNRHRSHRTPNIAPIEKHVDLHDIHGCLQRESPSETLLPGPLPKDNVPSPQ